jgi:hypothetical protein
MYFEFPGKDNSEQVRDCVIQYAKENDIKHIVVASNTGYTMDLFKGSDLDLTCVTHQIGFREPGQDEMGEEKREEYKDDGIKVLTTTHLMAGIERGALKQFGGSGIQSITAQTLRMFGQGTKVCAEIATMALDAGMIPHGKDIIAVAGSGRGADTAWVIRPAHSQVFYETQMKELICKPKVLRK